MDSISQMIANVLKLPAARVHADTMMQQTPEWDSLKHIELILELERHFGVELTGDDIAEMTSVRAIETVLARRGGYG